MSYQDQTKRRATTAIIDAVDLLGMANAAVHRARGELGGEAHDLASRICVHLNVLREVAELLMNEIQKGEAAPRLALVQSRLESTRALPVHAALAVRK